MKTPNRNWLLLVTLLVTNSLSAQLSGKVLLSGQSNHAGTIVRFTAKSATAVSDSCMTDASGSFSVNISGGTYTVVAGHPGYAFRPLYGAATTLLTNTMVIPAFTLQSGTATYVSGTVTGVWPGNVTRYVVGDLVVPGSTTLHIDPGTYIEFLGSYKITVQGAIYAAGTHGQRISFVSEPGIQWQKIDLLSQQPSLFRYCIFQRSVSGIMHTKSASDIRDCVFSNCSSGCISTDSGTLSVNGNQIEQYTYFGIKAMLSARGAITCNKISAGTTGNFGASSSGIRAEATQLLVENNEVFNTAKGISTICSNSCTIRNNYVHHTGEAVLVEYNSSGQGKNVIVNNTLIDNEYGLSRASCGELVFLNNIVANNHTGIASVGSFECGNNLFHANVEHSKFSSPVGIAQHVNQNANGHDVDAYNNVLEDPLFVSGSKPMVQPGSPAMNAGSPKAGAHIGADWTNICADFVTDIPGYTPLDAVYVFPNPFHDRLTIMGPEAGTYTVYNSLGVICMKGTCSGRSSADLSQLGAGVYMLVVSGGRKSTVLRIVKQ